MKFLEILRFEFAYQHRRPWLWVFSVVVLVLSFLMTRDGSVSEVLYADFFLNSPFSIAITTVFGGLIWLVIAASVAGEAAARDVASRMYPLIYTSSVGKADYLGGRFLAALLVNAFVLLFVQAGILLGVYLPGVDPELIGPFRPAAFFTAYIFISLPNAFAATAIQFWLAGRSGRVMAAYLGSFFIIFMGFFVASLLLFKRSVGTLLDPIGIRFLVEDIAHLWTPIEKNTRLLALEGPLLTNRLVWLGIGLLVILLTVLGFRFAHRAGSRMRNPFSTFAMEADLPVNADMGDPGKAKLVEDLPRSFGFAFHARQTLAVASASFRSIATSWAGLTILLFMPLLAMLVIMDQMGAMGTPILPTTSRVTAELTGSMSDELNRWVVVPFLIIFFAGELVWRERDAGMNEMTDTMPGSDWPLFLGKFLAIATLLAMFMAALITAGVLSQLFMDYHDFQIGLYLKIMFGLQLGEYLLFALLALVVHVVADQKYIGHLVAILCFVFIALLAGMLGIEHNFLIYGAGPKWSHTEMIGFGNSVGPWLWFKLYWAAWAVLLAVIGRLLWVRGMGKNLAARLRIARFRLRRSTIWAGSSALALMLIFGGFIFYNTYFLNKYLTPSDVKQLQAEYEKQYRQYAGKPQPTLTSTRLHVEMYPEQRVITIQGTYTLVNTHTQPIDSIHIATATGAVQIEKLNFDQKNRLFIVDNPHGFRVYILDKPLAAGDTLQMNFSLRIARRGFGNEGIDPALTENGSYFTSEHLFPFIGYRRQRELIGSADRRKYGLEPRPVIASLYEYEGQAPGSRGGGIAFEAVVGTSKGQVAVAPGALRRSWTRGNRNYFHYNTDAPIGSEWAFFSAHFAVHKVQLHADTPENDINIRIYHYPAHAAHVKRVARSAQAALDYYISQFGPYPYRHLTLVEHPGARGIGGHADAGLISYGQGFAYWTPQDDDKSLDFPYFVIAHEVAHQWTLPYAVVEGLSFLSEGLATYSALQAVKASRGEQQLSQLLQQLREHHPHAPIRRGEPLLRALDPYLGYRRGPFAMYALSEYIGAEKVNGALRVLIKKHDAPSAPLATTLDLYRELKAVTPDSLKYLLHDLFEVNTYWEFKTERAAARQTNAGTWEVTLNAQARKTVYDSAGVVTEPPMMDWVQVGVFADGDALDKPLQISMHRVQSGQQTIKVTVPFKPARAGLDPYHLLDWEQGYGNNIQDIKN
ncbi:ABC transporter permease/M1 family aminopeptidase [Dyadobacter psychrophilus]|uniref:ABC-2 family transporter protein n=1 Tax=Dyadobacter psychrophilus TaxID=651661 RepID=A0A1T5E0C8_9BACT|nr:ABC transporter permease [Dyadobacter psychrophilus]SKB77309.1 ABC-2 family transporter protein [Dyadobacter psychrophilus]